MVEHIIELIGRLQTEVAAHLRGDDPALTERSRELTRARADRLAATRDRLAEQLGDDHPRVAALTERHAHLSRISAQLSHLAERQRNPTRIGPRQWRLHGRMIDRAGRPVPDVRVHVIAQDGGDDIGKPAVTDRRGEYSAVYDVTAVAPDGAPREVTIVVRDAKGAVLLSADEALRPAGGETDYVEIILGGQEPAERTRCEAQTGRGTRCRNLAQPGSRFCSIHATR
jgi:hypothetical protein